MTKRFAHHRRTPARKRGGLSRCSPPARDGLAPTPDCLTMFASLYNQYRCRPPFADFRVNLRDGTTGVFACQRRQGGRLPHFRDSTLTCTCPAVASCADRLVIK